MLPSSYMEPGISSFSDFLSRQAPQMLPGARYCGESLDGQVPHGTTIVAATFPGGVVLAGDRRVTTGSMIAHGEMEKVFAADEYSAIGIAGSVGIAIELVRLFQVELEHYEKIEGATLSMDGKANRLSAMIKANLPLAMQGLAAVPLFAGYDHASESGRIYGYDPTGGRHEERRYHAVGSGSIFARGSIKKLYRDDLSENEAVTAMIQALYDAAEDDSATGGPDVTRRIYPLVVVVTADGVRRLADDETAAIADDVVSARMQRPDGPGAPVV